ncbi:MAG: GDSL-type esterase/lipase family protein [Bryobacterales bacterium]
MTRARSDAATRSCWPLRLLDERAGDDFQIYNRGISGNKVPDLEARWQADCLIKPDLLSILIGVNDIWHKLNGRYDGTVEDYEKGYTALLERTKQALPDVRLVICQPFVLRCGAVNDSWFPEFDQRKAAAERVAKKAGATWVPFQEMFDEALERSRAGTLGRRRRPPDHGRTPPDGQDLDGSRQTLTR